MLDILMFREDKGGNPELVRESQRRRFASVEVVDEVIELDKQWLAKRYGVDTINKDINSTQKEITAKMKAKESAEELLAQKKSLEAKKQQEEEELKKIEELLHVKLISIGNIVHDSVVVSDNEDNNELVRFWPERKKEENTPVADNILHHFEVLEALDAYDTERGSNVAGHRGYYLKDWGVVLNQALINYGIAFLRKRNYTALQTPFFMEKKIMAETAQLSQFDEELYKVVTGDGNDKYLIATSEQPISAFHRGEWLEPKDLPIRYCGISTCFRKEAGSHGKDTWGIFRVHQFEKVEQFVITKPEESWQVFDEMIKYSEEFYQSLQIPYRIVGIVSGALNNAAAKKYDLEAWFPGFNSYRELVSCSNCTDYQSRRMEIRCGQKKMGDKEKKYVHCLNSTLTATERTLCCIVENYQTPEGLKVPEVLIPFVGVDFIPYKKAVKRDASKDKPVAAKNA